MRVISEKTFVPIGIAIITIGSLTGWATRQEMRMDEQESKVNHVVERFQGIEQQLDQILEKLGIIEGELKRIRK